ncbi:MAG: DUF1592 domain-containing protein, partial [Acidobacteria bacterium]|nr:DUF1592 domain-containing protein [Acidobacteriota bacterium]
MRPDLPVRRLLWLVSICLLAAWDGSAAVAAQTVAPADPAVEQAVAPADPAAEHGRVLRRYCVGCHNDRTLTAGLTLQSLDLTRVGEDRHETEVWEKVIRKLSTRSMPPAARPRPDDATYDELTAWIADRIDAAAAERPDPGRRHAVHRLNRAEYANAIRDLLALDIDERTLLPPDDSGFGFDNIADVLSVSPMLTERYLSASRKIARLAVGDPTLQPTTEVFEVDKNLRQNERVGDDLPFGSRGGLAVDYYFPVDGEYVVKIFLLRTYDGRVRGMLEPHELEVRLDGALVESLTVGGPIFDDDGNSTRRDLRNVPDDGQEVRFAARAGPATLAVSFVDQQAYLEGMRRPDYRVTSYEYAGDQTVPPGIGSVELRGPYHVTGRGDTPSRQRIFTCRPDTVADEIPCATEIVTRIARRAFRRPVADGDIEMLLGFFEAGRARGDFDAGIEMALRRILVSPDFLFRRETDPPDTGPGESYAISDLELASRLSFFLWSSIPDDDLLDAAARGELRDPAVLGAQVRRMLADPRTRALVDNFGGQWLYLRNMPLVTPDPQAFPEFDTNLREAMTREMTLFLDSQIREDRSVLDLLTADYTFVNERLADHYGMRSIYGNHFRRVDLGGPQAARRGLLGKGSLLTVTSYADRTSPVLRGKWLLENILGTPPPPPPPDVPALEENDEAGLAPRSVRDRLEQHRANPVCASCHRIMDPLGFALENFDGVGRWRDVGEDGTPIDASGTLTDGTPVDGPGTLRQALRGRGGNFVTTVAEKLLTYAIGRGVESFDGPAVRSIVDAAAGEGYRWSALVEGIVRSTPFQM